MITRTLFFQGLFIVFIAMSLLNSGCSILPSWAGGEEDVKVTKKSEGQGEGRGMVKFSETPDAPNPSQRQYRRVTRTKIEEESEVHSQAGSMWVMEGQGAYLFTQNKTRREGDMLNVKIEGPAQKQVETKVSVIKKLLKQLEEEEAMKNAPPPAEQNLAEGEKPKEAVRAPAAEKKEEKEEPLSLESVPTRITERMADGNYRVKGAQPFMIGKREYKVIVTGIIRPEDYNDEGVSSNKLLDPQYDVVSLRRKE